MKKKIIFWISPQVAYPDEFTSCEKREQKILMLGHLWAPLKVPKREIFVTELFILSDPIWVGDMRTEPEKPFV